LWNSRERENMERIKKGQGGRIGLLRVTKGFKNARESNKNRVRPKAVSETKQSSMSGGPSVEENLSQGKGAIRGVRSTGGTSRGSHSEKKARRESRGLGGKRETKTKIENGKQG